MRKAFALIEMIGIMIVIAVLLAALAKPFRDIVRNIPNQQRDSNANSVINDMLDQLRQDVETSNGLSRYHASGSAAQDMLLIDSPKGVISYTFDNDRVARLLQANDGTDQNPQQSWDVPHGVFDWALRTSDGKPDALEITTSINRRTKRDAMKTTLENSHVIFPGINTMEIQR